MEEFQVEQLSLSAGIKRGQSGPKYVDFFNAPFHCTLLLLCSSGETPKKEAHACPEPGTELMGGFRTRVSRCDTFFTF